MVDLWRLICCFSWLDTGNPFSGCKTPTCWLHEARKMWSLWLLVSIHICGSSKIRQGVVIFYSSGSICRRKKKIIRFVKSFRRLAYWCEGCDFHAIAYAVAGISLRMGTPRAVVAFHARFRQGRSRRSVLWCQNSARRFA